MRQRFRTALLSYAALAVLAFFTLEGNWRWFVLVFLAALAFKSWLAVKQDEQH